MHSLNFHNTTSLVERQNSITLSGITNFLESGALIRDGGQWVLLEGPFRASCDANRDEITVYFPQFYDLQGLQGLVPQKTWHLSTPEMRDICRSYLEKAPQGQSLLDKTPWVEPLKEDFIHAFDVIQQKISQNQISKAVPVVFSSSEQTVTAGEKVKMILNLLNAPENLYVFGFWDQGEGVLGATPETLFSYQGRRLQTMALAGTCPKEDFATRDILLNDEKEMHEHLLVLKDILEVLKPYGEALTRGPYVAELPTLYHLKTDIELICQKTPTISELIKKLHPTPALGVAPRSAGYQWMQSLRGQEGRRGFGSAFAVGNSEWALCLVAIRNLQWTKSRVMIGSGCGVVAASEVDREWRELFQKRQSVRKILGLEI